MNRKRQAAISLSAAVLSGMLVYGVYWLQLRQVKERETTGVVVPNRFIPAGTTLTRESLQLLSLPKAAVTDEMVTDLLEAVGMETAAPLGESEPLLRWKVDRFRLMPKKGQATFLIPRDYVRSIGSGIRAGDRAVVYISGEDMPSRRMFADPVVVAGVKTASNLEIDDPKNPNLLSMANGNKEGMYASRRDANGTIDAINLNLTEEQWLQIDTACKSGKAKLVIAFDASTFEIPERGGE
ncbi:SAF domain-containing protein [Cohnella faecalis]|uniref:Flagellar biosynthesis protein FlgA n=1 Tax=Cohnella faecalis TaxID=2315694 RepID=A0A398CIT6_9BACL|nr:SAF domain-containing protein [Cohnella faecalis]RIE02643.1 flagellar biosynthesis protein FlgA [Cohnella faecalis]